MAVVHTWEARRTLEALENVLESIVGVGRKIIEARNGRVRSVGVTTGLG